MPDDPIVEELTPPAEPAEGDPNAGLADVVKTQGEQIAQVTESIGTLSSAINQALQTPVEEPKAAPAPEPPAPSTEEDLQKLTSDPRGMIREEAERVAKEAVGEARGELEPQQQVLVDNAHEVIMQGEQQRIDGIYGPGTFDEVIRPQIEGYFAQVRQQQPMSLASKTYVEANVRLIADKQRDVLNQREADWKTSEEARVVQERQDFVNSLPQGNFRKVTPAGDSLDDEGKAFLQRTAAGGGGRVDEKEFAAIHNSEQNSLLDYLKATGQEDRITEYFGE